MKWFERLDKEAREIVKHGEGALRLTVLPRRDKVSVRIIAGRAWNFLVEKDEEED